MERGMRQGRDSRQAGSRQRNGAGREASRGNRQRQGRDSRQAESRQRKGADREASRGNRQRQRIEIRSSQRDMYKGGEQVETDKETSNKIMVEVGKQAAAAREIYLVLVSESFV
jgi:hypothetical protein